MRSASGARSRSRQPLPPITRASSTSLERLEGPDDAQLARRWIEAQPAGLYVARSDAGVEAFAQHVYVTADPGLVQDDPVTRAVLDAVERHGPLRPGERIGVGRFFGGRGPAYQREPVGVMTAAVSSLLEWTSRPTAWSFITDPRRGILAVLSSSTSR